MSWECTSPNSPNHGTCLGVPSGWQGPAGQRLLSSIMKHPGPGDVKWSPHDTWPEGKELSWLFCLRKPVLLGSLSQCKWRYFLGRWSYSCLWQIRLPIGSHCLYLSVAALDCFWLPQDRHQGYDNRSIWSHVRVVFLTGTRGFPTLAETLEETSPKGTLCSPSKFCSI